MVSPEKFPDPIKDAAGGGTEGAAVLAGGCFWCVEAVYLQLDGVRSVKSGYAGGTAETADYETVCTVRTDHAEAVEIRFRTSKFTSTGFLKGVFSSAPKPTTQALPGNDSRWR